MERKLLRTIFVWAVSVLLVGGIAGGFFIMKRNLQQSENLAEEGEAEQTEAAGEYEAPKAAMTQEEMEALYDRSKHDRNEALAQADADASEETAASDQSPIDFEGMWEVNEDVYAWLSVPGTSIDYPVLQHETDNTYYLNYNIDGSYGRPGCIYTENLNAKDFTDNNTVIYGHNMRNGTMFADLHRYEDSIFFEENDRVIINTPEEQLTYQIFAAYVYDDRHLMYSFDFADEAVYANYLENVQNMRSMNANLREDIAVTADDRILTLSTCVTDQPDKRFLVQAVLLKDGE